MKDPFERTKVVVRRLPPGLPRSGLMEQIDGRFAGRYKWVCFRPGNNSQKNQRHARAYIDFNRPEDVVEFAEFFDGHLFVNEKGTQFKATVEYAPSQRVPKAWPKKDGREGTISKDPEYMEFLQQLAKPVENLPSAEIQLEKKEAERAGGAKESLIVTPLMDFVRQKRAAKNASQRSLANGKPSRRAGGISGGTSTPVSSKRGAEKRKVPTSMYVLRDTAKNAGRKEKSTFILVSRRDEQRLPDKIVAASGTRALDDGAGTVTNGTLSGVSGASESGKQRVILLKGKERDISLQSVTSSGNSSTGTSAFKQTPRNEASGKMIRNTLSKEARQSEQNILTQHSEKDKRPPRPPVARLVSRDRNSDGDKRSLDDKVAGNELHYSASNEKQDKRTRNKDRPDRGVWAPLRRSDGSHVNDDSPSSSLNVQGSSETSENTCISQRGTNKIGDDDLGAQNVRSGRGTSSLLSRNLPLNHGEMKGDMSGASRSGEARIINVGHGNFLGSENGSYRHGGRRGPVHGPKEVDGFASLSEGKHSKRAVAGYGSHEKQVWVQKAGSG